MRYKIDENNYITDVFFNCYVGTCAEYTGSIPEGYSSLEDWASNATIEAYYLSNGNLTYDSAREVELQAKWEEELQNNVPKVIKVIDSLDSASEADALSANQGKVLDGKKLNNSDYLTNTEIETLISNIAL